MAIATDNHPIPKSYPKIPVLGSVAIEVLGTLGRLGRPGRFRAGAEG